MRKVLAYIGAGIGGVIALVIVGFVGWGLLSLIRGEEISKAIEFALGVAIGIAIVGLVGFIAWAFETLRDRDY